MIKRVMATSVAICALLVLSTAAQAAEIHVLASTGIQAAVEALQPKFEKASGDTLKVDFSTTATLKDRIDKGEAFDVAILTDEAIDALIKAGVLTASSRAELARVGMGVAYKKGAAKPDVKTAASFKQTLLNAKSVAYTGNGATRPLIDKMFETMGITKEMAAKSKLTPPAQAPASVAKGESEIVISLISEFVAEPGVQLAGMLPAEYQSYLSFAAAASAKSGNPMGGLALIKFADGHTADAVYKAKGMEAR
jgi:molybdate transport system substrate-binding protein